jgi:hypothetical protein
MDRATLRGFLTLTLPSGLVLHDCTWHVHPNGTEWIGLPGKPQIDKDGQQRRDPATGKVMYSPVVEVPGKEARERFQAAALAAVHALLGGARAA